MVRRKVREPDEPAELWANSVYSNSIEEYDSIVRDLALRTGFPVVFPEYILAPEVQFPVQHEQCYDSLKWLTENGETLGLQGTNFTIVGDSAGGRLITKYHSLDNIQVIC